MMKKKRSRNEEYLIEEDFSEENKTKSDYKKKIYSINDKKNEAKRNSIHKCEINMLLIENV